MRYPKKREPSHPGQLLKEELAARGQSANALALALGVSPNRITEIIAGRRAITPDTAARLALYWGGEASFWLNLQSGFDLETYLQEHGRELEKQVRRAG